jgi:CheY-like chemotaxis protein
LGAALNPALDIQLHGARLLLVEDDEINQQVAREMLEGHGISVTIAENGEEAMNKLQQEQFDGVLMDMQMPVMDGFSTTRAIRNFPQYAGLPVIALTANVMVSEQNAILAAGMNDHIGKPIDPDRLATVLAKWIHPVRTAETVAPAEAAPASVPPAAVATLPDLPGVKVELSVRRIGGNVDLYYSLLGKFRENQKDVAAKIRETLLAGDATTAERLAHTLRGSAGTLGAELLQSLAGQLENSIRNGSSGGDETLLAQIDRETGNLIAKIDRAIEARG